MQSRFRALVAGLAASFVIASVTASGPATVNARVAIPGPATVNARVAVPDPAGVLVTDSGLVLPVKQVRNDGYRVTTTCSNEAIVTSGTYVSHVDVVLDPGHGGSEPGSVGANGLTEKELNLAVAKMVRADLIARGYSVLLTRTTDMRVPLRVRAAIANSLEPDVFVSIHHNGGARRRSRDPGTETYHQVNDPDSIRLAGILYEDISAALSGFDVAWVDTYHQGANARTRDGANTHGLLRWTPELVSVITEAAWLSNPPEARLLADPAVQAVEARAIADGIVRYLTTDDPGSGYNQPHADGQTSGTGGVAGCVDPHLDDPARYTSLYGSSEWAAVRAGAQAMDVDPGHFQKLAVYLLAFLLGLGDDPAPLAPSERPTDTGTTPTTTGWDPIERLVLAQVADAYHLSNVRTQKFAALALAFLLRL